MNESRNSQRMMESTATYIDDLFDIYSKMDFIRLDLSYTKEHAREASLEDINQDLTHLLNNRRTKPSIFKNMVGHILKKNLLKTKVPTSTAFLYLTDKRFVKTNL